MGKKTAPVNKLTSPKGSSRDDKDMPFVDADPITVEDIDPDQMRKSEVYKDSFYNEGSFHSQGRHGDSVHFHGRMSDYGQNLLAE
jgi:hypothetical protein